MAEPLEKRLEEPEEGLSERVNDISKEEKPLSFNRMFYHLLTFPPLAYLSYAVTGISGVFFTTFLTLGGMVKRKKIGKSYSGEKTFRDLKAGALFSHLVYGLYKVVNMVQNPIIKTLALNPLAYAIFNGAYLGYTYLRDTIMEKAGGYKVAFDTLRGNASRYMKQVWNEELKPYWMKLNLKTLVFLPVNYLNVNKIKELYQQIFVGSLIDFAYGIITTRGAKKRYA